MDEYSLLFNINVKLWNLKNLQMNGMKIFQITK